MWEWVAQNWDKITTAIFGILSVLFAGLAWKYSKLAYERDQARVKLVISKDIPKDAKRPCFICRIINSGRRPVTIVKFELTLDKQVEFVAEIGEMFQQQGFAFIGDKVQISDAGQMNRDISFPQILNETESIPYILDSFRIAEALKDVKANIINAQVEDSLGNVWIENIPQSTFPELYASKQ